MGRPADGAEICRSGDLWLSAFRYGISGRSMPSGMERRIPPMYQQAVPRPFGSKTAVRPGTGGGPQSAAFAMTARISGPYFSSFAGPMPLTRRRAAIVVG